MICYGRNRSSTYTLVNRLGGGGEGEVYEVEGKSNIVAKIYFDKKFTPTADCSDPRRLLEEKINTMLDQPVNPYVAGVLSVAWPQDILYDQNRKFVGYTMPKVTSKHHIYAASRPRERKMLYPNYTWKTAVIIAYNLSLAVKNVHDKDVVIGDLNPNNIMLDEKGHVTLIDTDSFSVTNRRTGKVYKCGVGVAEMLAPELQGKDLSKSTSTFTKQTDSFALGIHIFNLLMNNCHPFGCVGMNKSQSSSSNNPIIHNITRGKCPYVTGGKGETSPDAPDVMMLPSSIRTLFDRTFRYDITTAVKSSTISNRPSAEEWQNELYDLYSSKLKTCSSDSSHMYPPHYGRCPWCALKKPVIVPSPRPQPPSLPSPPPFGNTKKILRDAWPLWLVCILVGVISGPLMSLWIVPLINETGVLFFELPMVAGYIIFALGEGATGALMAFLLQKPYQTAKNVWPWFLFSLLIPILGSLLTVIAGALITLAVMLAIIVLYFVLAIGVIGFLISLCTGG